MMSALNPSFTTLFLVLALSFKLTQSVTISCPELEKQSLLNFKQSLNNSYNLLSSWDGEVDCCKWKRVVCNNSTGNVHQLHLQGNVGIWDYGSGLSGKISPSLLNLKHLTYLNLSYNSFDGQTIPSFIGSLSNLEHLDLSFSGFQGKIPHNIGNLSNLLTLVLESYSGPYGLKSDRLEWLSGLKKLENLNMNSVELSRATNWAKVINSIPSLLEIHLSDCHLDFLHPPNNVNLTSLTLLDLSSNQHFFDYIPVPVPLWCFQLPSLLFLDLSSNPFEGPIPSSSNATELQHIDFYGTFVNSSIPDWLYLCNDLEFVKLSYTSLEGKISDAIGNLTSLNTLDLSGSGLSGELPRKITNLCKIKYIDLSSNELEGKFHDSFGNMSECFLGSLEVLRLWDNQLSGNLAEQFGEFKILQTLDLRSNSLSGAIPISLGNVSFMEELLLDGNRLTGNLPHSLGQLSNLAELYIEDNKLEGIVTESHFSNLSNLVIFCASGNHLSLNVGSSWVPPIALEDLGLESWSLGVGSEIPSWFETQRNITRLDLSNTGISGTIPSWFLGIWFLNVSHNNLHGKIPPRVSSNRWGNQYLYMSSNKLSGSLPRIGVAVTDLDLSHNLFSQGQFELVCDNITNESYGLRLLHLEGNRLSGELPDGWEKWPSLAFLKLGNNTISGNIPNSIGLLAGLQCLSLYGNKFYGQIPSMMYNCTKLWKIDLSRNTLDGNLPTWMGTSLVNLKFLILRSNKLSGEISSHICHLQSLQILDLSNNKFSGIIPRCVSNFTAMATVRWLELERGNGGGTYYGETFGFDGSHIESASVVTKGVESEYSTILSLVTNIDLSSNNLSGDIPKELTSLVELGSLNLSGNHFTGSIPESIGDMKQLESLDLSRNYLSGLIPNSFKLLSSLNHLNLSLNKLTGRIPESTQLQSFDASSFRGNDLCGPPLTSNCSGDGDEVNSQKEENEGDHKSEIEWFLVLLSLGYAVGFSGVSTALVLKKSWRDAYFGLLQGIWDKVYVFVCIQWIRLTKPSALTSRIYSYVLFLLFCGFECFE